MTPAPSLSQQIALLMQRQEILIGTVDNEFRGFREEVNALMIRQTEAEKKALVEEARITNGFKRVEEFYNSYGLDRRAKDENITELKKEVTDMKMRVKELANSVGTLVKAVSIVGTAAGLWIVNNILGLIK